MFAVQMSKSLIALAAGLAMVAADVPNTRICNHDGTCFLMPVLGEGKASMLMSEVAGAAGWKWMYSLP